MRCTLALSSMHREAVADAPSMFGIPPAVEKKWEPIIHLSLPTDLKIMIVDDEPVNLQVLVNYLSPHNYVLIEATNEGRYSRRD